MSGSLRTEACTVPWEEVLVFRQPDSRSITIQILDGSKDLRHAVKDLHFDFESPGKAAAATLHLASAREQGMDAAIADLTGIIGYEVLAEAA